MLSGGFDTAEERRLPNHRVFFDNL